MRRLAAGNRKAGTVKTSDPRIRVTNHGRENWRTEVQDGRGAPWDITGPPYPTKAEALSHVDQVAADYFGDGAGSVLAGLRAQVEQLTAEKAELAEKLRREEDRSAALLADGYRKEQRALALLPDCDAHRRELQYLRHCVSWYWESMNNSNQARGAVVLANLRTAGRMDACGPDGTVKAAEVAAWLRKNADAQKRPLARQGYPTLADCLRSAAGQCEHEAISDDAKKDIAEALGLAVPPF
jgi:hypothetical protein